MSAIVNAVDVNYLHPIDREGLLKLAAAGKANPEKRGTIKVKSEMQGVFRSWNYVGLHNPVIVDEPPHLLGENTAPAPGELLLSAFIGVGITAVATAREVKLSKLDVFVEGDIGNSATWGADGAEREPHQMGFQAVRVKVDIEGDASPVDLEKIIQHANFYSPIANSFRNPIAFEIGLSQKFL
jgi:uncharacterized OsmC-like protein